MKIGTGVVGGSLAAALLLAAAPPAAAQLTPSEQVSPGSGAPHGLPPAQEPQPAPAAPYPRLTGEIYVEVYNDNIYRSDAGGGERNLLYTDSTATLEFRVTPEWSLQSTLHVESLGDEPGDRTFRDHGLYLEQLYAFYDGERFQALAGKFNLGFGFAWDRAPGVYGTDFAYDYELNERLGFGGGLTFGGEDMGEHRITARLFLVDNTPASYTAFERRFEDASGRPRRRNRERYPGVANTAYPTSFAVATTGAAMPFLPGLAYNLGFIREDGDDGARNETGGVFGLEHTLQSTEDLAFVFLGEVAGFEDFQGSDEDRLYLTGGLGAAYGPWGASVSATRRRVEAPGDSYTDLLFQASAGYTIDLGELGEASINLGWKTERVERDRTETVGLLLTYSYAFGRP